MMQQFLGVVDDGSLDLYQVADEFPGGPASFAGAGFPFVGGDGIGSGQECPFRASQIFSDGSERGHSFIPLIGAARRNQPFQGLGEFFE
jgi:hypothetical protein